MIDAAAERRAAAAPLLRRGRTYAQAAKTMGISRGAFASLIRQTREKDPKAELKSSSQRLAAARSPHPHWLNPGSYQTLPPEPGDPDEAVLTTSLIARPAMRPRLGHLWG